MRRRRRDSWEKRQRQLDGLERKGLSVPAIVLSTALALIAAAGAYLVITRGPTSFNSARWKANDGCKNNVRGRMVDDLKEHHLHTGMPKRDVRVLLGPPYTTYAQGGTWYSYFLNPALVDCHVLDIEFRRGRLTQVREGEN